MKAVRFDTSMGRFVAGKLAGSLHPSAYTGPLGSTRLVEVDEPPLPGPDWAVVHVRMGGICGSDLSTIFLESSPSTSALVSFPFILGHENVGVVHSLGPAAGDIQPGQRVVVDPVLACQARGIDPPCESCRRGEPQRCYRFADGRLAPGLLIGFCRDTGGSWGERFVAHTSQLVPVPDGLSDEAALMAEPFAVALHPVLRTPLEPGQAALVIGAGTVGLCTVAALRATGSPARIVVAARYPRQAEMARRLGADVVVTQRGAALYKVLAEVLDTPMLRPIMGKPVPVGGADVVFECVGSSASVDDALRFARPGGRVVLVGLAAVPRGVDWTPIWLKELTIHGSFCYGYETVDGRRVRTIQLALELMAAGKADLAPLVTHRFPLDGWRQAIGVATRKGPTGAIKVALIP